jgi:SAM-dependent methyltransferase
VLGGLYVKAVKAYAYACEATSQFEPMVQSSHQQFRPDRALAQLVRHTVLPEFARRRPDRVLLISPEPLVFSDLQNWNILTLHRGNQVDADRVACDTASLPFQDDQFDAVILHHVFRNGREPELHETWRVLRPGGDVFVLGHGSVSWRARPGRRRDGEPAMKVMQVCQQLRRRAFAIEQCAGSGWLGIPLYWERRWQRPALPFADTVLVHGRHRPLKPIMRPLHFGRTQTVGVRSTAAENVFRNAE